MATQRVGSIVRDLVLDRADFLPNFLQLELLHFFVPAIDM